jgi:hypothetical protein
MFLLLLAPSLCLCQIALGGGGLDDPDLYHQRYRGDDSLFAHESFFQWWFFWVQVENPSTRAVRHFTVSYATSRVTSPAENNGGFVGFSFVDEQSNSKAFRVDHFKEGMNTTLAVAPLYCKGPVF